MSIHVTIATDDQTEQIAELVGQALHFNLVPDKLIEWVQRRGLDHFRVIMHNGRLAAVVNIIDMGQWFGGVALPTAGISAVGVAPEFRGRKFGEAIMDAMLREMHEQRVPLSTLYPASTTFYRKLGYEKAGSRIIYELVPSAIRIKPRGHVEFERVKPVDATRFDAMYQHYAAQQSGMLRRPALMWDRVLKPYTGSPIWYSLRDQAGADVGYLSYVQAGQKEDVRVLDWCALTPAALDALLEFWAGHRTLIDRILMPGAPNDPMLFRANEQGVKINWQLDWMLRLIDVEQALIQRRYPVDVACTVHFDLHDSRLAWNQRRFVMHVRDGIAQIEAGGNGDVMLDVRDLAALYTGYCTAFDLALAGHLHANAHDLATLNAIFAAPRPWMLDMF